MKKIYFLNFFVLFLACQSKGQDNCSFITDGTDKSIGMKIKLFYPCNWTMKDGIDSRTVKTFISEFKNGFLISSNLVLIPTPTLLSDEQFEHAMSSESITKMMKGKGNVQEIRRLKFDKFDGAEILVKTIKEDLYYYSYHYYMYCNKGLMVLNYFVGAENDSQALSGFNKNKNTFRKIAQNTTLLNPLPNHGVTISSSKPTYEDWTKKSPIRADKSDSTFEIAGSLYRNYKYSFRIRFPDSWQFYPGDGKNTVIKSGDQLLGKSISIMVAEFSDLKIETKEISDNELQKNKQNMIAILKAKNMKPIDLKVIKGYLNNFPAQIVTYKVLVKQQTKEVEYFIKIIHCINRGKMYSISLGMPSFRYDNEESKKIDTVIESFEFE